MLLERNFQSCLLHLWECGGKAWRLNLSPTANDQPCSCNEVSRVWRASELLNVENGESGGSEGGLEALPFSCVFS